jgi:polysaccharide biosynthesis/export protein
MDAISEYYLFLKYNIIKLKMKSFIKKYKQGIRIITYFTIKRMGTFPLVVIIITLLFSSCVTQRNLEYLRVKDRNDEVIQSYNEAKIPDYKLKPNDELHIQIRSLDDASTNIFEIGESRPNGYSTPYSVSLSSFIVDKSGYIQYPVIGNIFVENRTVQEVTEILQDSLINILSMPTVTVKLVNRYVSVLGEVNRPGHYPIAQEKLTIYNALAAAGDINVYGDRDEVILNRTENGKNLRISIDLMSSDILASEYYYMQPNDMIYVKPMRKRFWGFDQFPWGVLISSITTGVLLYNVIGK